MKFGLALPNSGPIAGVDAICRVAELAEAAGFDALLVHDHIHYDTEWLGHRTSGLTQPHADITPNLYESLITLAWVARATTTVRLATAVLVLPLRDPRVLARQLVTLQALARGRLTLGVGSGDYPGDYRVMEVQYRRKAALTRDYLDALAVLLPGGRADFQGETLRIDRGTFFPEVDPIPILLGGGIRTAPVTGEYELFEPTLRLLARRGHGWMPEGPAALIAHGIERIAALVHEEQRRGVRFEIRAQSPLYIGADDAEAMARVNRGFDYELVGTVATIRARLARYRDAGVHAMNVRCFADDEAAYFAMIQRFAEEIMPAFATDGA